MHSIFLHINVLHMLLNLRQIFWWTAHLPWNACQLACRLLVRVFLNHLSCCTWFWSCSSLNEKYYFAIDRTDGSLLVSDPNSRLVYRIPTRGETMGERQVLAGTGAKCQAWEKDCGDEGPANMARFTSPRGRWCFAGGKSFFGTFIIIIGVSITVYIHVCCVGSVQL